MKKEIFPKQLNCAHSGCPLQCVHSLFVSTNFLDPPHPWWSPYSTHETFSLILLLLFIHFLDHFFQFFPKPYCQTMCHYHPVKWSFCISYLKFVSSDCTFFPFFLTSVLPFFLPLFLSESVMVQQVSLGMIYVIIFIFDELYL